MLTTNKVKIGVALRQMWIDFTIVFSSYLLCPCV
jgi:hypothetical protein